MVDLASGLQVQARVLEMIVLDLWKSGLRYGLLTCSCSLLDLWKSGLR